MPSLNLSEEQFKLAQKAAAIICDSLTTHFTIIELAKKVGLPEKVLKQAFKQNYGMGVYSYLRLKRMEKAKELMMTGMPTRQVVEQIGYCYDSNFTKAFRKVYNETPAGWKKDHAVTTRRMPTVKSAKVINRLPVN